MASKNPLIEFSQKFSFDAEPVRLWNVSVDKMTKKRYGEGKESDLMYCADAIIPLNHPELRPLCELLYKIAKESGFDAGQVGAWLKALLTGAEFPQCSVSLPLRSGDDIADDGAEKGKDYSFLRDTVVLGSYSKNFPPGLDVMKGGMKVHIEEDMRSQAGGSFYSGVNGSIEVNLTPYQGNARVPNSITSYLTWVWSLGTGDRIGGGSRPLPAYAKAIGQVSNEDVTKGMTDEIPF